MPGERITRAQLNALNEVLRIHAGKLKVAVDQQLEYLKSEIAKLTDPYSRQLCEIVFLSTMETVMVQQANHKLQLRREARLFWTSVGFLILALIAVFFVPHPTRIQIFVIQLIASLAAAGFVAFIPGLLALEGVLDENSIFRKLKLRATGAFAVFVLVWFYVPSLIR
jgi:hypothetical protein